MQKSKTFTHCILVDSSTYICWTSPFVILGVFCCFYSNFDGKLANTVDPDQTPHYVASDWVCTVCLSPFYGFPGKNGLMVLGMCTLILTKSDEHLAMASLLVHWQSDQLTLMQE